MILPTTSVGAPAHGKTRGPGEPPQKTCGALGPTFPFPLIDNLERYEQICTPWSADRGAQRPRDHILPKVVDLAFPVQPRRLVESDVTDVPGVDLARRCLRTHRLPGGRGHHRDQAQAVDCGHAYGEMGRRSLGPVVDDGRWCCAARPSLRL